MLAGALPEGLEEVALELVVGGMMKLEKLEKLENELDVVEGKEDANWRIQSIYHFPSDQKFRKPPHGRGNFQNHVTGTVFWSGDLTDVTQHLGSPLGTSEITILMIACLNRPVGKVY